MENEDIKHAPDMPDDSQPEDQLALLAQMSQEFATSLDIDETLNNAIKQMMDYLEAEAGSIFLLENNDQELVCRACAGPIKLMGLRLGAEQGIVGRSVQDNRVQMVRNVANDPNFTAQVDEQTGFKTRSILCAPLAVKDVKIGAIELINKNSADGLFAVNDQHMLTALAALAALSIHNAAQAAALVEQERIQRELELAREIQANLLPASRGDDFPVHGLNLPMLEVSGDFYDFFVLDDGRIVFNLADVSGKGMNAALLMAKTSSLFHCLGKTINAPGQLLTLINNEICENTTRGMFVTLIGGIFDPESHSVTLANAGHHPPIIHHNGEFEEIETGEMPPLGIIPNLYFPDHHLQLDKDALYLYTDGVTEAQIDGEMLGEHGLQALITRHQDKPVAKRLNAIINSLQKDELSLHDDVTMMIIEGTDSPLLVQSFPAKSSVLKTIRKVMHEALHDTVCSAEQADAIVLAASEAAANIIQHAYADVPDGIIDLALHLHNNELTVVLRDYAGPIDISTVAPRALQDIRPGGLGTHFMQQLMDNLVYTVPEDGIGNRLTMRISLL